MTKQDLKDEVDRLRAENAKLLDALRLAVSQVPNVNIQPWWQQVYPSVGQPTVTFC